MPATVRRVLLTTPATDIFVAQGKRRKESEHGLTALDVSVENQVYLGLPDGELWQYQDEITDHIVSVVLGHNIGRVMTLGSDGYDHHPDHITSHLAAENAVQILRRRYARDIGLLTLNSGHVGHDVVSGTPNLRQRKLSALAAHQSQFPFQLLNGGLSQGNKVVIEGVAIDADFWDNFARYQPLVMAGETYDAA